MLIENNGFISAPKSWDPSCLRNYLAMALFAVSYLDFTVSTDSCVASETELNVSSSLISEGLLPGTI